VQPILKNTVSQRDNTGTALTPASFRGNSMEAIVEKIWTTYHDRIKGRAVRTDDMVWSIVVVDRTEWTKVMQLKFRKKLADSSKTPQEWNSWLVHHRGKTISLLIYEYGSGIARKEEFDEFCKACVHPTQTDRAGAAAESSLREVVHSLQDQWGTTFQAEQVVWRMWANHITRNLNRSTWESLVLQPPPDYIAHLLQLPASHLEGHLATLTTSANLALDCVDASLADAEQVRRDLAALTQRLDVPERGLLARKSVIEALIRNIPPPPQRAVIDPLLLVDNVEDTEHQP
jgi:hypothetical protein